MKKLTALLVLAIVAAETSGAASTDWTGGAGPLWSDPANWSGAAQPVQGDSLAFTGAPGNQPSQNDLTNLAPDSLTFSNAIALTLGGNGLLLGYPTGQVAQGVTLGRASGNASGTFATAHGFAAGQIVSISGAGAPFDGFYAIAVPNSTQIAFSVNNSGPTTASGSAARGATIESLVSVTGRTVTIGNGLELVTTQYWNAVNANGTILFTGNLTGTGHVFYSSGDTRAALPSLRLAGTNSGFTGNLVPGPGASSGWMLMHPAAMIAGNIDLGANDRNLWIQGGPDPYTFGVGTGPGSVSFRSGGQGGLKVSGSEAWWDPGNGGDYSLAGVTNARVRFTRSVGLTNSLHVGNSASRLILSTTGFTNGFADGGTAVSPLVIMRFALSDDGSPRPYTVGEGGNSTPGLVVLTRAATGGDLGGRITIDAGAAIAVSNMNQLFTGNLDLRNSGLLVLDGVSWADFAANRSAGFGSGASQWRLSGGGFAARGTPLTIPNDDSAGLTTASFDTNFVLGSAIPDPSGGFYANAPVTLARDTSFTIRRTVTIPATGAGLTGSSAGAIIPVISGSLSGGGSLQVLGTANAGAGVLSEVVLSGTNDWTGPVTNAVINTGIFFNAGPGGLHVRDGLVRFDGDASLPSGNGGNPSLLGSVQRNGTDFGHGFLLAGGSTEKVYDLPANARFLIGSMATAPDPGIFGAAGGRAKLQNSTILVHDGGEAFSQSGYAGFPMGLFVRDGAVLTLGDGAAGPVRFVPSRGQDTASSPTAFTPTTAVSNRVLQKRGEGTLVLRNVGYTDVAGASDLYAQFVWMIGRGSAGNNGAAAYFDGAVRGLAPSDPSAAVSNSLLGFWISLRGGVYEIDNSGGGSGTFNRWLSIAAAPTNISVGNVSGSTGLGGGGFAAYGGNVTVDLNLAGSRETLNWAQSNSGFVQGNDPLLFGSQTADANVEFFDHLALGGQTREIRVIDNTNVTSDRATLSGTVSGTGGSALLKSGAGTLVLAASNTYSGGTVVTGGTLLVNAAAGTGTGAVNVASAGTLGGNGTIRGPVVVAGRVRPGDGVGTLFLEQSYTQAAGGGLTIEAGGAASVGVDYDALIALGAASLAGNLTVTLTNGYTPASGDSLTVLQAASVAGTFDTTNLPALGGSLAWVVEYQPAAVVLSVTNTGGGPPPPTGYDLAATAITNGLSGYADDADGDGFANLLEYVTGANLTNADTLARMDAARTNSLLALRFLRATNATDTTLIVEGSFTATNGADWVGIATNAGGSWGGATNVTETGAGTPVNVSVADTQAGATNRFLRLRVTRP